MSLYLRIRSLVVWSGACSKRPNPQNRQRTHLFREPGAPPAASRQSTRHYGDRGQWIDQLTEVGDHFFLYDGSGSGPSLKYAGAEYVAGQFGAWTPIGAEQTASGYEVAWKVTGADQYTVWTTDSSGNYISQRRRRVVVGDQFCVEIARNQFPPRPQRRRGDRSSHDGDRIQWIDQPGRGWGPFFPLSRRRRRVPS